jgi:hypothetical protein
MLSERVNFKIRKFESNLRILKFTRSLNIYGVLTIGSVMRGEVTLRNLIKKIAAAVHVFESRVSTLALMTLSHAIRPSALCTFHAIHV